MRRRFRRIRPKTNKPTYTYQEALDTLRRIHRDGVPANAVCADLLRAHGIDPDQQVTKTTKKDGKRVTEIGPLYRNPGQIATGLLSIVADQGGDDPAIVAEFLGYGFALGTAPVKTAEQQLEDEASTFVKMEMEYALIDQAQEPIDKSDYEAAADVAAFEARTRQNQAPPPVAPPPPLPPFLAPKAAPVAETPAPAPVAPPTPPAPEKTAEESNQEFLDLLAEVDVPPEKGSGTEE